ncbi:MAG: riboflavin kinase [Sphaerochaetaceae bacterium]|nr:riboflavin kinase [Sphaerochaetaceae bacterium]
MLYSITGPVVHGKGLGHRHMMPTANQEYTDTRIPFGVYGGICHAGGKNYYCITNIGQRPSIDDSGMITIESLLLDFEGDLYGMTITVDLYFYIRPIMKFPGGIEDVKKQLEKDSLTALEYFRKNGIELS